MKEYVSEAGGRYTYTDDILNLQELALSITSIFTGCANFIISGCEIISESEISSGYVWINKKVRYFEGGKGITLPYYLIENNTVDSVTYANEAVKRGRENFLCTGSQIKPSETESGEDALQFIEVTRTYAPRFIDKFMGKYAVLLETPFSRQTIKKDLIVTGTFSADKAIESKTSVSISNTKTGHVLKGIVKEDGRGTVGLYYNGLLVNELSINTDGSFTLLKQDRIIAKFNADGVSIDNFINKTAKIGSIYLSGNQIINIADNTDTGEIGINYTGQKGSSTKFRNFNVYDGKQNTVLQVVGKTKEVGVNGKLAVKNNGEGIVLQNIGHAKGDTTLTNTLQWTDNQKENIASIGFDSTESFNFNAKNAIGNILLSPKDYVDIKGGLRIKGKAIENTYVNKTDFQTAIDKKVDKAEGKQLSTEDFTTALKDKLDGITTGDLDQNTKGYVTGEVVKKALEEKADKLLKGYNSDDKKTIATNIGVYTKEETDGKYPTLENLFQDYINYQITKGTNQADAQRVLRDKIDCPSNGDVLKKSNKLSDLSISSEEDKKQICSRIGAAYAKEYQTKLKDTGWIQMENSGGATDTSGLFVRQIGNIISIQGKINTGKRNGSNKGGVVAVIPNQIDPPRYSVKANFIPINHDEDQNDGAEFYILGGSRNVQINEEKWYNQWMELNFTYMN